MPLKPAKGAPTHAAFQTFFNPTPPSLNSMLIRLEKRVTRFEDDLRQQCKDVPAPDARPKAQYQQAKDAGRTACSYPVWRDGELTQAAVGWVLSCVFVRFLEDNDLLERSFLSGVGENRARGAESNACVSDQIENHGIWWNFAGRFLNEAFASVLDTRAGIDAKFDDFSLRVPDETAAAGGLNGKSIAPNGLEKFAIARKGGGTAFPTIGKVQPSAWWTTAG